MRHKLGAYLHLHLRLRLNCHRSKNTHKNNESNTRHFLCFVTCCFFLGLDLLHECEGRCSISNVDLFCGSRRKKYEKYRLDPDTSILQVKFTQHYNAPPLRRKKFIKVNRNDFVETRQQSCVCIRQEVATEAATDIAPSQK